MDMYVNILKIVVTSVVSILVLFLITKLIGDRQMSQLSMFDYINGITIGSIAAELATSLEEIEKPLTALIVYGIVSFTIAYLTNKSIKLRRIIEGQSLLIYDNGTLYEKNLMKAKLDIDEFLTLCRLQGYFNLEDIHTAILEPNGNLSFIPVAKKRPVTPEDLNLNPSQDYPLANVVVDGHILEENLKSTGKNQIWLEKQLHAQGVSDMKEIILATVDNNNKLNVYLKTHKKMTRDIFG